ncbi:MAG: hypothetical protein KC619_05430 [Myxococcales bacterium]|nr:hypothetical protein [Myxococcales bacterium]
MTVPLALCGQYGDVRSSTASLAMTADVLRWVRTDGRVEARSVVAVSSVVRYEEADVSIELEVGEGSEIAELRVTTASGRSAGVVRKTRRGGASDAPHEGRWDGFTTERAPLVLAVGAEVALVSVAEQEVVVRGRATRSARLRVDDGEIRIAHERLVEVSLPEARAAEGQVRLRANFGRVPGVVPPCQAALRGLPPIGVRVADGQFLELFSAPLRDDPRGRLLQFVTPSGGARRAHIDHVSALVLPPAEGAVRFELGVGSATRPASLRTELRDRGSPFRLVQPTGVLEVLLAIPERDDGGLLHVAFPFGEARHPAAPAYFAETDGVVDASPLRPDQIPSTVQAFVAGIELFVDP